MHLSYCRDKGPKSIYWAVGLVRGHLVGSRTDKR